MDEKKAIAAVGAAGFDTPYFQPILTDAGNGKPSLCWAPPCVCSPQLPLLEGDLPCSSRLRQWGGVHRVISIHVRMRSFTFSRVPTNYM